LRVALPSATFYEKEHQDMKNEGWSFNGRRRTPMKKVIASIFLSVVALSVIADTGDCLWDWYLLPAVAHAPGKHGTFWQTDVAIVNPYPWRPVTVSVYYLPKDQDNSYAAKETVTIGAGDQVTMTDVVLQTFGVSKGSGALLLVSEDGAQFSVNARTFTGTTEKYGLMENGQKYVTCRGESAFISGVSNNSRFRTNVGAAAASSRPVRVLVEAYDDDGRFKGEEILDLESWGMAQIAVDSFAGTFSNGYLILTALSSAADAQWVGYATPIDNNSGDSTFNEARTDDQHAWAEPYYDQTGWWEGSISTALGSTPCYVHIDQNQSQLSMMVYNPDGSFNTLFEGFENRGTIYVRDMFMFDARCFGSECLFGHVTSESDAIHGNVDIAAEYPNECVDGTMTLNLTPTQSPPFKSAVGKVEPTFASPFTAAERLGKGTPKPLQRARVNR
jgi:hypothetical protein